MKQRLPAIALTLLAVALAAHALVSWPFYVAEMWTWRATGLPWWDFLQAVVNDRHPPLHPLMVLGLRQLTSAEWVARLPSALGSLAAIWAMAGAGRQALGRQGFGLLAALVLLLTPAWISWAGVMRAYPLMLGCGAGLLWAALTVRDKPMRGAFLLALLGTAGLYLHYVMAAPVGVALAGGAVGALRRPPRERLRALGAVVGAGAIAVLALLPWYLQVAQGQAQRAGWAGLTAACLQVYRYLLFEVDDLNSMAMLGLLALAVVGLLVSVLQRRGELVMMAAMALVLPLLLATNSEVRVRVYAFIGLLPLVVLLATVAVHRLLPRAWPWALVAAVALGPDALTLVRLPSNPYGGHGENFDDGIHDIRRSMALLQSVLPPGSRLVVPFSLEPNVFAHYAPDAAVEAGEVPDQAGDWRFLTRSGPQGGPPPQVNQELGPDGCVLEWAFTQTLRLPDEAACRLVLEALASQEYSPWLLERAMWTEDPAESEDLLRRSLKGSTSPTPHLLLASRLVDEGRGKEAEPVIDAGLGIALKWTWRLQAASLLSLQGRIHEEAGDNEAAGELLPAILCLRSATPHAWLQARCLSPLTSWTVKSDLGGKAPRPQKGGKAGGPRRRSGPPP